MPGTEKDFATFVWIGVDAAGKPVYRGEAAGFDGGDIGGDDTKIHEPGQQFPTPLGGLDDVDNPTVFWWWKDTAKVLYKEIKLKRNAPMLITRHVRNADRSIEADPFITYTGLVGGITAPSHDSASSTEAKLEVEMLAGAVS